MDTILEQILKSPLLNKYSRIIQKKVEEEEEKRLQFYNQITEQEKAEFIDGEIICHSPIKFKHNFVSGLLYRYLSYYVSKNKLGFVGYEKILIKLTRNDFEPDICFFKKEISDEFTKDMMFFPAPNFVVEVLSESTAERDRGVKFIDYALHGVGEYWIIDPEIQCVEQYVLHESKFEFFQKHTSGIIRSFEIEDFVIPVKAIFDEEENFKILSSFMK